MSDEGTVCVSSTDGTLAPLLPCDPERLIAMALAFSDRDIIGDPFHTRANQRSGATTREAAFRVSVHCGYSDWHDPEFQASVIARLRSIAEAAGRRFGVGPTAFGWLSSKGKDYDCT
jgi:hypothetical protein